MVLAVTAGLLFGTASPVMADPPSIDSLGQCSKNTATNGIDETDVTGNNGGSNDCWGTATGTDPQNEGFSITDAAGNVMTFTFVSKVETSSDINNPNALITDGFDIGLTIGSDSGDLCTTQTNPKGKQGVDCLSSGTWSYDSTKFTAGAFLLVVKAASDPGYAVWIFDGTAAASDMGTWLVSWGHGISHLAIYANNFTVPTPGTLALLGLGFVGLGVARRRRS